MNPKAKRYLSALGAVGAIAIALLAAGPFLAPIYRFFAQFPGIVYWIALPLPIALFAVYILARSWGERRFEEEGPPRAGSGRLAPLAERIERSEESEFARAGLVYELSDLAARLIARRDGVRLAEARERLRREGWPDGPPALPLLWRRDSESVPEDRFLSALEETITDLERFYEEV